MGNLVSNFKKTWKKFGNSNIFQIFLYVKLIWIVWHLNNLKIRYTIAGTWKKKTLLTIFDRKSRFCRIRRITKNTTEKICELVIETLQWYDIKTITADNWREFADWELIEVRLGIPVYFTKPHKSRQKWTNEHGNRCIRKRVPQDTSFSSLTDEKVQKIEYMLNHKPRGLLGYKTPYEVFYEKEIQLFL